MLSIRQLATTYDVDHHSNISEIGNKANLVVTTIQEAATWNPKMKGMIISTRLKIWTLVTHAFIVIGMGHGLITLGIFEVFSIGSLLSPTSSWKDDGNFYVLLLSSLFALFGQIAMILSIYAKSEERRKWLNIVGLCLLCFSVIIFAYAIREDNYSHLAIITCLPFAFCTIRTMLGGHIQRLCRSLWQKMGG